MPAAFARELPEVIGEESWGDRPMCALPLSLVLPPPSLRGGCAERHPLVSCHIAHGLHGYSYAVCRDAVGSVFRTWAMFLLLKCCGHVGQVV